ncbi:hypothetical protein ACFVTC_42265 [Streptomyces sp. NPDC057950]|uniref:hypothetical protein n=1 Tax=Streptomyces sp. NPDC057950 TaxID=3346288 RepID=UPI0036E9E7ED
MAGSLPQDEERFFIDTLAEYQWSRDVAGLASSTLENLIRPVVEVCDYYRLPPWRITSRHVDQYFAGPGKCAGSTVRQKMTRIDHYYAFPEQRYGGEVFRRFGAVVESPVEPFNRPAHRGDYTQRIPPSARAVRRFFAAWRANLPNSRKLAVACRDYAMAKLAYVSGVRASELCGMTMSNLHWEYGSFGRFEVMGKGARRSGPRPREAVRRRSRAAVVVCRGGARLVLRQPGTPSGAGVALGAAAGQRREAQREGGSSSDAFDLPQGRGQGLRPVSHRPGVRAPSASSAACLRDALLRVGL